MVTFHSALLDSYLFRVAPLCICERRCNEINYCLNAVLGVVLLITGRERILRLTMFVNVNVN